MPDNGEESIYFSSCWWFLTVFHYLSHNFFHPCIMINSDLIHKVEDICTDRGGRRRKLIYLLSTCHAPGPLTDHFTYTRSLTSFLIVKLQTSWLYNTSRKNMNTLHTKSNVSSPIQLKKPQINCPTKKEDLNYFNF